MSFRIHCEPFGTDVYAEDGMTVLEAVRGRLSVPEAVCSGNGSCGKCVIRVLGGAVSGVTQAERRLLGERKLAEGFRLACQTKAASDISVCFNFESSAAPEKSRLFEMKEDFVPEPETIRYFIPRERKGKSVFPVSLDGIRGRIGREDIAFPYRMLEELRRAADSGGEEGITVTVDGDTVISAEAGDTSAKCLGVAFDIGTTTVFAALCDMTAGVVICTDSTDNSQGRYGADVISRIEFCCREQNGTAELQRLIVSDMNRLIRSLLEKSGEESRFIYRITAVGNTTMCHLLLGVKPESLSKAPFVPLFREEVRADAGELGLEANSAAAVYVLPGIAGFVGSDITAVAAATDIAEMSGVTVAVDIGTNGEILAAKDGIVYACSTAAGPAFEGACIRCGMRAAEGVISSVRLEYDVRFETIGSTEPVGICGSGLIDLTAQLLKCGLITPAGVLLSREAAEEKDIPGKLKERLFSEDGENGFLLYRAPAGEAVALYQKDIREIQLAKAAIMAGIKTLLKQLNVGENEIGRVLLSGAFGSFIDPDSAGTVGLIPQSTAEKAVPIGNGAGVGAVMALLSAESRRKAEQTAKSVRHIDLSKNKDFYALFAGEMLFRCCRHAATEEAL